MPVVGTKYKSKLPYAKIKPSIKNVHQTYLFVAGLPPVLIVSAFLQGVVGHLDVTDHLVLPCDLSGPVLVSAFAAFAAFAPFALLLLLLL